MANTTRPRSAPPSTEALSELMGAGELPEGRTRPDGSASPRRVESVSVVIPAKNEAENLGALLDQLEATLEELDLEFEILVVDDGSTDGTGEIARRDRVRVVRHPESLGNGAAVKRGIREARQDWVLLMDGDGQHPPDVIPALVRKVEEYDMVVASRGGGGGSWYRNLANRVYNWLASYVTSRPIPDLTSGFRIVRADVAKSLVYLLPNTFSYPTTITLAMIRCGYSVGFEPFTVRPRRGKSHVRLFRDGSRFFLIIIKIATFFAPLRVFLPLSILMAAMGLGWYAYVFATTQRFTNMSALLLTQATVIFVLGLVSEQVAALRFERLGERPPR
jgi:glycosyltransferase involved in cell wall biosynthesis